MTQDLRPIHYNGNQRRARNKNTDKRSKTNTLQPISKKGKKHEYHSGACHSKNPIPKSPKRAQGRADNKNTDKRSKTNTLQPISKKGKKYEYHRGAYHCH